MHRRRHQEVRWEDPASTSGSAGVEASRTTRASISSMARMIRSRGSAAHRRNCSRREPSRVVTLQSTASSLRSAFRIVFQLHLQRFDIDTVPRTSGSVSAGSRQDRNQADITRSGWFGQRTVRFPHEGRKARAQTNWRAFPNGAPDRLVIDQDSNLGSAAASFPAACGRQFFEQIKIAASRSVIFYGRLKVVPHSADDALDGRRSAFECVLQSCPGDRPPGAAKDLADL